jgi:hypothetical protein
LQQIKVPAIDSPDAGYRYFQTVTKRRRLYLMSRQTEQISTAKPSLVAKHELMDGLEGNSRDSLAGSCVWIIATGKCSRSFDCAANRRLALKAIDCN